MKHISKEIALESCPIHNCKPYVLGPGLTPDISPFTVDGALWKSNPSYVLSRCYPDALLFPSSGFTVFCPKCAKNNPFGEKHNKFGYGFCSQYKLNAAKRNWNNACIRYYARAVKEDLKI